MATNLKDEFDKFYEILQNYKITTLDKIKKSGENLRIYEQELASIDKGDASENAPLQIAKDKIATENSTLHKLNLQLEALETMLDTDYKSTPFVHLGSIVRLQLVKPKSERESEFVFKVVLPELADFATKRLLATDSIVGKAIMDHDVNSEVTVVSQSTAYTYKILEVY